MFMCVSDSSPAALCCDEPECTLPYTALPHTQKYTAIDHEKDIVVGPRRYNSFLLSKEFWQYFTADKVSYTDCADAE